VNRPFSEHCGLFCDPDAARDRLIPTRMCGLLKPPYKSGEASSAPTSNTLTVVAAAAALCSKAGLGACSPFFTEKKFFAK
jgi:hypothetical protein